MRELRRIRRAKDMTQEELGRQVGLTAAGISALERGDSKARQDTLINLADALDVTVDELLGRRPKAEAPSGSPSPEETDQAGAEERSLPTAEEMDSVTALLERLVAQRHKNIDQWRDAGLDALEAAICGSIEMDAANDQLYRDLQDRGADEVLERWKDNPNLVAEVDSKAARRQDVAFYELRQTAVRARNVAQELSKEAKGGVEDLAAMLKVRGKNVGAPLSRTPGA